MKAGRASLAVSGLSGSLRPLWQQLLLFHPDGALSHFTQETVQGLAGPVSPEHTPQRGGGAEGHVCIPRDEGW